MKQLLNILLLLIISATANGQVIGGSNTTVEVKGGMKVDSALKLPLWNIAKTFHGKGTDSVGIIVVSTTDSLLYLLKKGVWTRQLSLLDSNKAQGYIAWSQKGIANGVATLDGTGKVPSAQLPAITANDTVFIDTSMAQMLGHTGSNSGVISIRTDSNAQFILSKQPSSARSNWLPFTFNGVLSFKTRTGAVIPRSGDYITDSVAEGPTNLYYTNARVQTQIIADTGTIIATIFAIKDSVLTRVKYSDTAAMLAGYPHSASVVKYSDTAAMLAAYASLVALADTASIHRALINSRVKYTDTAGMLIPYRRVSLATALTGDITGTGATSIATTLATVNSNVGTFGNSTHVASFTVNGKGLITAVVNSAIDFSVPLTALNDTAAAIRADMVGGTGLNGVLSVSPNTNQDINIGEITSLTPYTSVFVGLNHSDSSGKIVLKSVSAAAPTISLTTGNISMYNGIGDSSLITFTGVKFTGSIVGADATPATNSILSINSAGLLQKEEYGYYRIDTTSFSITLTNANEVVAISATLASDSVYLPAATTYYNTTSHRGIKYIIKRTDASGNTLTIKANGSEAIDGSNTITIPAMSSRTLVTDGVKWYIL